MFSVQKKKKKKKKEKGHTVLALSIVTERPD